MDSTKDQKFGPNKAVPPPIDLTNRFYEISANSTYSVEPFVDLSAVPLLASVPGIGSTATLSAKIKRCAEFPQGLVRGPGAQNSGPSAAMQPALPPSFASPALAASQTDEPWNRPQIYEEIAAAGLNEVGHTVVLVMAKNSIWTDTGLTVNPGQTVWLDFRADGLWSENSGSAQLTADGYDISPPDGNLIGCVGPAFSSLTRSADNFIVGSALYKYKPTKTGPLMLGMQSLDSFLDAENSNNNSGYTEKLQVRYDEHKGSMTVRIIVTQ